MKKFFIEIGSADFNTLLCLDKNRWEGIIVEPVTEFIENLTDVDHIIYETSAITDKRGVGVKKFKYYDPEFTEGHWRRGISLIVRDENIDEYLEKLNIKKANIQKRICKINNLFFYKQIIFCCKISFYYF